MADPRWRLKRRYLTSYDVICNKKWNQLIQQAQGYLINVRKRGEFNLPCTTMGVCIGLELHFSK